MNVPADSGVGTTFELLPVGSIAASTTATQGRRRRRFTPTAMAEMVASVRQVGVIEPILVVKHEKPDVHVRWEIVAGERRWLAAQEAGLALVPAIATNIARDELVQFQLIENKQRETLHPLDEAEGFGELMRTKGIKAEAVAELIGLSRSHVYGRLKLLDLSEEVSASLEAGEIDHSKALLIARIPGKKLQKKALKIALEKRYDGTPQTEREVGTRLRDKFMVRLDSVPFDIADDTLRGDPLERGACTACPHFSENDPELQAELNAAHGIGARICTDKPCHDIKVQRHFNRVRDTAYAQGRHIIDGIDAKAIKPDRFEHFGLKGYIDLDAEFDQGLEVSILENLGTPKSRNPTYRELLGDGPPTPDLFIDPYNGRPRDVLDEKTVAKLLKAKGVDYSVRRDHRAPASQPEPQPRETAAEAQSRAAKAAEEETKRKAREELERAFRLRLVQLIHERWKGPLKRDELEVIAHKLLEGEVPEFVDMVNAGNIKPQRMNEPQLSLLLFEITVGLSVEYLGDSPAVLLAAAKRFKIDPVKVRKEVRAALGAEDEPAPAKKKAGKKAKRK